MELCELVAALMAYDALAARQWVADSMRMEIRWADVVRPAGLSDEELAVAAGVSEPLAQRMRQLPPSWTQDVA